MNLEESVFKGVDNYLDLEENIELKYNDLELDPCEEDTNDVEETNDVEDTNDVEEIDYIIPKNIFLTHKSISYIKSKPELRKCLNSWLKYKNKYRIFYYDNASCDSFIKNNFSDDVYRAYCRLPMAVMKADLWRYCIIYKYGGIYTDADAECRIDPDIFTTPKTLLVCGPEQDNLHLCQWCFAAPKNSPIIKSIIDLSVERILTIPKIQGEHIIHYLTGPKCFTDGIELYLKEINNQTFVNKLDYQKYRNNVMCVFDQSYFTKIIYHYFAGQHDDGWKRERFVKLR